jgi:hypothetical protein
LAQVNQTTLAAALTLRQTNRSTMNDQADMQLLAPPLRYELRYSLLSLVVFHLARDQPHSTENTLYVNVDGKHINFEAVHHDAECGLRPDSRQVGQVLERTVHGHPAKFCDSPFAKIAFKFLSSRYHLSGPFSP